MRHRTHLTRFAAFALASVLLVALVPLQAAVRPPKLQYQITTLPNGLRVILSEDQIGRAHV